MKPPVAAPASAPSALKPSEVELIEICVRIAQFIGLPKSVGELYGLLFVSSVPLPLDGLAERLSMSRGSASQGLKYLRAIGAVRPSYVAGDRRDHYLPETDLHRLVGGFVRERITPGVADLADRLGRIGARTARLPAAERRTAQEKLAVLQGWQRQAEKVVPLAAMFLGKK